MKKTVMKNQSIVIAVLTGVVFSASISANDDPSGIYIAPTVGYNVFDNALSLEDDFSYSLGMGYKYETNWAAELAYTYTDTQNRKLDTDVGTGYWHLDGLYYFNNISKYTPFIVLGVGEINYDYDLANVGDYDDTQWTLGAGVSYAVSSNVELRADVRGMVTTDEDRESEEGVLYDMGFVYYFGQVKAAPKPAPVVALVVKKEEPAPVAEPVKQSAPEVEKDTDADGVMDGKDKCPDTSEGAMVDVDGCYRLLTKTKEITLNVTFQSAKSVIEPATKGEVENLAKFLTSYPQTNVIVEGHTDSVGSAEYNKKLSQQRADAVKQSLVADYKIAVERITAIGYGEEKPIADNLTKEGQAQNRRVMAKVSAQVTERQ